MFGTYRKVVGIIFCLFSSVFAYFGGSGEPNNPYQIATVSDWQQLMSSSSDWNKNFIMTTDVNLQGVSLTPVGKKSELMLKVKQLQVDVEESRGLFE